MAWRKGASRLPSRAASEGSGTSVMGARASVHGVEGALEAAGVGLLGLGQGLEPVGALVVAFLAGGAGHAWIHVGVFVRFAGDGRLEIEAGGTDGKTGGRIANPLHEFQMPVRVAGFPFGGGAEDGGDIIVA